MHTYHQIGFCFILVFPLSLGCSPKQAQKNADPNVRLGAAHSGSPNDGGRLIAPASSASLSQREWEQRLDALLREAADAYATGNQLVYRRKLEAVDAFLNETWKPGATLAGWIGRVGSIEETTEKYPDEAGKPALRASLHLTDAPIDHWHDGIASIELVNYDPPNKRWTGLEHEFESLKTNEIIRVSGHIHTAERRITHFEVTRIDRLNLLIYRMYPNKRITHFVVTRIEPVDYAQERGELLARCDALLLHLHKLSQNQQRVLHPTLPAEVERHPLRMAYYGQLGRTYPAWRPAVAEHNRFMPPLTAAQIADMQESIKEFAHRLKRERFLDEKIPTYLKLAEAKTASARAEMNDALEKLAVIESLLVRGLTDENLHKDTNCTSEDIPSRFP